ncbi:uncharacterized protein EV420DRAFT_1647407 [Desarmillaria tabescens]|uniref:Restriction of telomere capping protein 4 n=1 Tax=Armillaria tabescens TaxID=1929756 RepID=A0AA39JSR9_ARMTA|nr:uncharacterized protein EV420DRAFT_1647407 [Desarmillaria tabescens]KAK0448255.1 hypothetical protein EV420DRAFT_1647407 [Desarmillaria tabescens]
METVGGHLSRSKEHIDEQLLREAQANKGFLLALDKGMTPAEYPGRYLSPLQDFPEWTKDLIKLEPMAEDVTDTHVTTVDPKTLCPFCDQVLPRGTPSEAQLAVWEEVIPFSTLEPNDVNPLHCEVSTLKQAKACGVHLREIEFVLVETQGWPLKVDWNCFEERVKELSESAPMLRFIENDRPQLYQFAQPGYYGQRGIQIISNVMRKLLQELQNSTVNMWKFDEPDFVNFVLVPEVGWRLIMQDMAQKSARDEELGERAWETMVESARYGTFAFAWDDGEDGVHDDL